jgi:hypothetical protein
VGMVGDTREPIGVVEMSQIMLQSRGKGGSNLSASRWIRWVRLSSNFVGKLGHIGVPTWRVNRFNKEVRWAKLCNAADWCFELGVKGWVRWVK